jgi:hypothetical protein
VIRHWSKDVLLLKSEEQKANGARTYYRDAMLISLDKEGEDASDDDNHKRRNGRHPEQIWHFLSLNFLQIGYREQNDIKLKKSAVEQNEAYAL